MIGFEVEAWLVLAVLCVFGADWIDFGGVKDFAALITLLVTALAYVLGILADRAADTLLDAFEKRRFGKHLKRRMRKKDRPKKPAKLSTMRMTVMHRSDGMIRFLDYQRSRWRIARATVVNLALAGPLAAVYLLTVEEQWWALLVLALTPPLLLATYFIAIRIKDAWVSRLVDAYCIVMRENPA